MKTVMSSGMFTREDLPQKNDFEVIKLIADAKFGGINYDMLNMKNDSSPLAKPNYMSYIKEIKKALDDNNLPCLLTHSLYYRVSNKEDADKIVDKHKRAIEIASFLDSPIIVVHPAEQFNAEQNYEMIYSKLLPFAKSANVKIATENMWDLNKVDGTTYPAACGMPEDFCKHIDIAGDDFMCACLDIGHASMPGAIGAPKMIRALGKRIKCIHVHDNDFFNDDHTMPFQRNCRVGWFEVINALRDIGYDGDFTFETGNMFERYPFELLPSACRHLKEIGDYFVQKITE